MGNGADLSIELSAFVTVLLLILQPLTLSYWWDAANGKFLKKKPVFAYIISTFPPGAANFGSFLRYAKEPANCIHTLQTQMILFSRVERTGCWSSSKKVHHS